VFTTSALLRPLTETPTVLAAPCADVEVVFARGTGEPPGVGEVGQAFVDSVRWKVGGKSLGVYGISYPASMDFPRAMDGIDDVGNHVEHMAATCPNTDMVLGGFCQGAAVMGFVTSAAIPDGAPANAPTPMAPDVASHVAAVALFGTPSSAFMDSIGAPPIVIGPLYMPKTAALWLTSIAKAMHEANITTPEQQAAFLAQIAEESGGLRMVTELPWGLPHSQWTDEQAVRAYFNNKYANMNGNGGVGSGDGYNYRGRGILQITGKSNYAAVSEKLYGDDRFVKTPDLLSQPDEAAAAAAAYWNENDLNRFIPPGQPVTPQQFQDLGSTINTGHPGDVPNNAAERVKYWELAKEALGLK
jgi:predicted chitinase